MTYEKAVSTMSGNFLTEKLPSKWQDMDGDDLDKFILDHVSSSYENWEIDDIWTLIEQVGGAAFSMHEKAQQTKETFDAIEDTLPLIYVTSRIGDILKNHSTKYGFDIALRGFHRECLIKLGTCALSRHLVEEEIAA